MRKNRFNFEHKIVSRYCAPEKTTADEVSITMYRVLLRDVHMKMKELENYSEV